MEPKLQELTNCPENELQTLASDLRHFRSDLKRRWSLANNTEARFLSQNKTCLDTSITIHNWSTMSTSKPGRPNKTFQELIDRSKRRKTKELREQVPVEELTYAARVSQRKSGNIEESQIIKDINATPTRAKEIKTSADWGWKNKVCKNIQCHKLCLSLLIAKLPKASMRYYTSRTKVSICVIR